MQMGRMEKKRKLPYLFCYPQVNKLDEQFRGYGTQVLLRGEAFETCVVSKGHDPKAWKRLWKKVLEPHYARLLVRPSVHGITVKSVYGNQAALLLSNADILSRSSGEKLLTQTRPDFE